VPVETNPFWPAMNFALVATVLASPLSDMCRTEHRAHNQGSCHHHSYPSFSTQYYSTSGLNMFRTNSTTELQYICLGYFTGNRHKNVPENTSPPHLVEKNVSCYQIFNYFQFMVEKF
jgi:hypothetical protein